MSLDSQLFKDVMSTWTSGVTVVTTVDEDDNPKGMTASAFSSVSLDPMLILVCVNQKLYTHQLIVSSKKFAVNILGAEQIEFGKLFAGMTPEIEDRFAHTGFTTATTGSPILPGVPGWLDCEVHEGHSGGDHTIFIGRVVDAGINGPDSEPLLYARRSWGTFQAFE